MELLLSLAYKYGLHVGFKGESMTTVFVFLFFFQGDLSKWKLGSCGIAVAKIKAKPHAS